MNQGEKLIRRLADHRRKFAANEHTCVDGCPTHGRVACACVLRCRPCEADPPPRNPVRRHPVPELSPASRGVRMNENLHTDDCTDCGCDETCTVPPPPCDSPIFRTIARDYGGCDHCELAYQPGDLIGRYRGRDLCEACADHKAGELLFYGSDLEDA